MPETPKHRWPYLVALVILGGLGIYFGAPARTSLDAAWHRLADAPITTLAIIVGGALGLVATEALRIAVIGRLVGVHVRPRDAWDAAVANHVMTAITPQVGLGEPTVAYLLGTRGIAWDQAVAIPFIKFTTSLALIFAIGTGLVALGYGPPVATWITASGITLFAAISVLTLLVLFLCARPAIARRIIGAISRWLTRRFTSEPWQARIARATEVTERMLDRVTVLHGWRNLCVLLVVHFIYYASYIAPLVGLALVLGHPPVVTLVFRALIYLCFIFALPTPGGAGPSEAAAGLFFADLVSPADAIIIVAVFRAATFYLQLAIGVVYVPLAAALRSLR